MKSEEDDLNGGIVPMFVSHFSTLLGVIPVYTHTLCGMIGWHDIEKLYSSFLSLFFSSGNWSKRDTFLTILFCFFKMNDQRGYFVFLCRRADDVL